MPRLRTIGEGIWLSDGPVVRALGMPFPTRMVVIRLKTGALWIGRRSGSTMICGARSPRWASPRFAVEPNKLHHLALADWVAAWPALRCWAPPGLARKRRDVEFAGELSDEAPPEWRDEIDQLSVPGNLYLTEVLFFHRRSRTCLVGDLIQRHELASFSGWRHWVMKWQRRDGARRRGPTRCALDVHPARRRACGHHARDRMGSATARDRAWHAAHRRRCRPAAPLVRVVALATELFLHLRAALAGPFDLVGLGV